MSETKLYYHTIITCVNFSDYLEFTYKYNKDVLENITIISDHKDKSTAKFCKANNISLYQTEAFYKNDSVFNKAGAINCFLINNINCIEKDKWILFTDADTMISDPINQIKKLKSENYLHYRQLISCPRKIYYDIDAFHNNKYFIEDVGFYGYFQFFHKDMIMPRILKGEAPIPEYKDASVYDILFVQKYWKFLQEHKIYLDGCYATHIGEIRKHWKGRIY